MPELYVEGLVFPQEFEELGSSQQIKDLRAPFFGNAVQVGLLPDELVGTTKEKLTLVKPGRIRALRFFDQMKSHS